MAGQLSAERHFEWLQATKDVKALSKARRTTEAFSTLFARAANMKGSQMLGRMRMTSTELLRRGKVRLDAVAMMVTRDKLESMFASGRPPHLHILCDASPQHRGLEMFAASLDIVHEGVVERMLLWQWCGSGGRNLGKGKRAVVAMGARQRQDFSAHVVPTFVR